MRSNQAHRNEYEILILGGGPGGLQLGLFLDQEGWDYQILEADEAPGAFFKEYPRHRKLISINKVYTGYDDPALNLRYDWNSLLTDDDRLLFKNYSKRYFPPADVMIEYLAEFAEKSGLNLRCNARATHIAKDEDGAFRLTLATGETLRCRKLVVATGVAKPYVPDLPGIEMAENYRDMTLDPQDYVNQRVLIIGKGNSAFETADHLVETTASIHLTSPHPLKLAWKSHHVGHLRALNNNFLDTYLLKSQNGLLEAYVREIAKKEDGKFAVTFDLTRAHGATATLEYDRVIACTGFQFDAELFDPSCRPELTIHDRFPAMTSSWESVNTPNLYFAGTIMQSRDFKKTQSGFIHGFRFNIRALSHILNHKHHDRPWPHREIPLAADALCDWFVDRMNRSAALWHQPGFLCDLVEVDAAAETCRCREAMPAAYLREHELDRLPDCFILSLDYGPDYPEFPFEFNRYTDQPNAHLNPQLHPIVRRYRHGEMVAEHHVLEEMEGVWRDAMFISPLADWLRQETEAGADLISA